MNLCSTGLVVSQANWTDKTLGDVEVEAHSSGSASGSVKMNKLVDGLKLTVAANNSSALSVDGTYTQDLLTATAKISHSLSKGSTGIDASVAFGIDGVAVGGSVQLDGANIVSPKDFNVGAQYSQKDLVAALVTSNLGSDITASYFQSVSGDLSLGSSMLIKPDSGSRTFTFGGEYSLDKATTLKGKIDSSGTVGTSVTHVLANPSLKFCVSAQFDALSSDVLSAQKFGVSINLGDF